MLKISVVYGRFQNEYGSVMYWLILYHVDNLGISLLLDLGSETVQI